MSADGLATLDHPDVAPDGLRPCVQRALAIWDAWVELADRSTDGQTVSTGIVDLERTQTCLLRTVIEEELDEDLHPQQLFRAMRRLALLSGSTPEDARHARNADAITGGTFEYYHRHDVPHKRGRHALVRVSEGDSA